MRTILTTTCLLLVAAWLPAQTQNIVWHTDSTPSGGGNAFPWGSNGIRYQTIVSNTAMGGKPAIVQDIFVAGSATPLEIVYDDIEIRMGLTAMAAVGTDWNTNNPNPTVVYRGPLRVRFEPNKWLGIGLPKPYLYLPRTSSDNLCFELIVWATPTGTGNFYFPPTGGGSRAFRYQWTTNQAQSAVSGTTGAAKNGFLLGNGNFVVVGTGCKSSTSSTLEAGASTWPQASSPVDITLTGAKPVSPAVLMLGGDFQNLGAIKLPFDLAPLGAPNCFVWNDFLVVLPAVANAAGDGKITLPIPASTGNARVYFHWWNYDPTANSFGWTTSSQLKLLLGN